MYLEQAGSGLPKALAEEFTRQFPNVTFDIQSDTFVNLAQNATRIITGPTPPDLFRFPPVAQAAQAGIISSMDPYVEAYGWESWPQSLLDQTRVAADGSRGTGSLYGVGLGYNVTGVFYNKKIAGVKIPSPARGQFSGSVSSHGLLHRVQPPQMRNPRGHHRPGSRVIQWSPAETAGTRPLHVAAA